MSPEVVLGLVSAGGGVLSAALSAGIFWGLTSAKFNGLQEDVSAIKQVLALEPSDGKIASSFATQRECDLREDRSDARIRSCEGKIEDHEHRLTAVETRVWARAE
jgi:hypothetical protein